MSTNLPNRAQIESAQPLDFPPAPPRELRTTIRIEVAPDGLHVTAEYSGTLAALPDAIERLRAAGVFELVAASRPSSSAPATPPPAAPAAGQRQAAQRVERIEPTYTAAGDALCPKHHKPLKQGQWGLYCPAKDESTVRGYCALKFAE